MIKQQEFFEYLKTVSITILVIFVSIIALLFSIQHKIYADNMQEQAEDTTVDYNLIGVMIEKNKALEAQSPANYKINMKLGTLYEIKKDYKNSEIEYKKAIYNAPCNEFKPEYKLTLMYLHINKLEDAESVMDTLVDEPDKMLIKYKADIYEKLADRYYNSGDYEGAIDRYEKSLFYWKINGNKKEIKYVQNSLASSYVYLADEDVSAMQPQDAINSLKNVLTMFDAPILKYKLALLLMTNDPDEAYRYFEEVYKEAPELINYDTYCNFLSAMAIYANSTGDTAQAQLYQYKQKKIKEFFETNILSVDDIVLEDVEGRITLNNWFKRNNIYLEAKLKNVSKDTFDSLFIQIVFKDKEEIIGDYTEQIVDKKSLLLPGRYSPLISIRVSAPMSLHDIHPKTITAEIYASKTVDSLKLHLTSVGIKEQIKPNRPNKFLMEFGIIFDKITSKLPSFLF